MSRDYHVTLSCDRLDIYKKHAKRLSCNNHVESIFVHQRKNIEWTTLPSMRSVNGWKFWSWTVTVQYSVARKMRAHFHSSPESGDLITMKACRIPKNVGQVPALRLCYALTDDSKIPNFRNPGNLEICVRARITSFS